MRKALVMGLIRNTRLIIWRTLQAVLIYPSLMIGSLVMTLALMGEHPVQGTLEAFFEYADTAIRPAPIGFVLQRRCTDRPQITDKKPIPLNCESWESHTVPVADAIAQAERVFLRTYFILIAISLALIFSMSVWHRPKKYKSKPDSLNTGSHKP